MIRWGAVFWNGVKLWKLRQWPRQLGVIRFRIIWLRRSGHLAFHARLPQWKRSHGQQFPDFGNHRVDLSVDAAALYNPAFDG
jgi:hypothetical protein